MSEMHAQANGVIVSMGQIYTPPDSPKSYVRFDLRMNPTDTRGPREATVVSVQAAGGLADDVAGLLATGDRVIVLGRWGVRGTWTGLFAASIGLDLRSLAVNDDEGGQVAALPVAS